MPDRLGDDCCARGAKPGACGACGAGRAPGCPPTEFIEPFDAPAGIAGMLPDERANACKLMDDTVGLTACELPGCFKNAVRRGEGGTELAGGSEAVCDGVP